MRNKRKTGEKSIWDYVRYRKQSLVGKIIIINVVLLIGSVLVYILLTISMNRWTEYGIYSVWILFGWFFFIILVYVSFKLISLLMHKENFDTQKSEGRLVPPDKSSKTLKSDRTND